ncbi:flagellar motor switch protein FliN [Geothermobacter hydrogeniphilus]|uniref:Flagellar motor switch protein FliN n=1 Tax=Geothermobacter hydrogeniphilus TaxID=1969733 RepID=A0A1X0YEI7_9BACT|nr:flagellar motor switch protein FliN [Geothermobacter hydrogeniphilus]ORJ63512.1 flagellar motor switch protein FliN [Geothermobacter hydrogeniphilus]
METDTRNTTDAGNGDLNAGTVNPRSIDFLLDIPLNVSVEVGRSRILVKELLQMREGYVIELDKLAGEPLDLYVNSKLIARGEAVLANDKFGLRLTDVISPAERIENLG